MAPVEDVGGDDGGGGIGEDDVDHMTYEELQSLGETLGRVEVRTVLLELTRPHPRLYLSALPRRWAMLSAAACP